MREKTIDAIDIKQGQTVTRVVANTRSLWRNHTKKVDRHIEQTNGRWPTVTMRNYLERGEDDQPTVYLEMSDEPGRVFCLRPDDQVTVEVA